MTGMPKNTTGTSTTTCTATGESMRGLPLRHDREDDNDVDKLQLRNLHSFLHCNATCQMPPREHWRRTPPRTCAQTCPNKCSHLHSKKKKGEHNEILNWRCAVEASNPHTVGWKTGTRRPIRRRTRETTEKVVPEVGNHVHENGSRLRSCCEGPKEVRGSRRFRLFFLFLLLLACSSCSCALSMASAAWRCVSLRFASTFFSSSSSDPLSCT